MYSYYLAALSIATAMPAGSDAQGAGAAPRAIVHLPAAMVGRRYDRRLITGGRPPFSIVARDGLPPGLGLSADGRLAGLPTTIGSFRLHIIVRDTATPPQITSQDYAVDVVAPSVPVRDGSQ